MGLKRQNGSTVEQLDWSAGNVPWDLQVSLSGALFSGWFFNFSKEASLRRVRLPVFWNSKSHHSSMELHFAHFLLWVSLFSPGLYFSFSEDKLLWHNYQQWVKGVSHHLIFRLLHLTSDSVVSSIQLPSDSGGGGGAELGFPYQCIILQTLRFSIPLTC